MNKEEQHAKLLKFQAAGERLKSSDDFKLYLQEIWKEYTKLRDELIQTRTIDPVIAELQGNLKRLETEFLRASQWIKDYHNFVKDSREEEGTPITEDYDRG